VWYNGVVQKPNFPQGGVFMNDDEIAEKIINAISAINKKLDDENSNKIEEELQVIEDAALELQART
jgi:hypothetical protein